MNFTLDWGEAIFDGGSISNEIREEIAEDICALQGIFATGKRASWELAVSLKTRDEIMRTRHEGRRHELKLWLNELLIYWHEHSASEDLSDQDAASVSKRIGDSCFLAAFPDAPDRELIAHAVAYGCDVFCTRDRRSVIRHREKAPDLGLRFLTPAEWWTKLRPWAALWV